MDLNDRVALVTGSGAGIGQSISTTFAELGARIVAVEIDEGRAHALRDELGEQGHVIVGDVCDDAVIGEAIAGAEDRWGRLDIVVNNVGDHLGIKGPFEESTPAQWEAFYNSNLHHVFAVTKHAIPLIRRGGRGGSIINISTIEAFRGIPLFAVYSACNAAIGGFTRSLALELGRDGIKVNAIAPETTETLQVPVSTWVAEEHKDSIGDWIPLGRFGLPSDVAGCAVFLASDLSAWVTGTTIHVDGGALAAGGWIRTRDGRWTHTPLVADDGYGALGAGQTQALAR